MTIKLLRDARVTHKAGEIVEVSPAEAMNLIALKSAVAVPPKPTKARTKKEKK